MGSARPLSYSARAPEFLPSLPPRGRQVDVSRRAGGPPARPAFVAPVLVLVAPIGKEHLAGPALFRSAVAPLPSSPGV